MAFAYTNRAAYGTIGDRFALALKSWKDARNRRALFSQTRDELYSLSDRDLSDMGIHRSMIDALAREAVYGK
jgi:uncharacterized protein YjiS (DUF1127 family)